LIVEREGQPATLYDFLYKDAARLASYYAQMFGGRLTTQESVDLTRATATSSGKLGFLPVVSGERGTSSETSTSSKRVIDPHDLIAVDVLASLMNDGRVQQDPQSAAHNSLVLAFGTVIFIDRHMLQMATATMSAAAGQLAPEFAAAIHLVTTVLGSIVLPSAFLMETGKGFRVVGTIKEGGMEEPISSYYFKHGTAGLSDVYVIGVKEVASTAPNIPSAALFTAAQQASQALSDMLFPQDAIRITPLALFRKL
jgi:hypothetical protein